MLVGENTWSRAVLATLYFLALAWSFMGVGIVADKFMEAIEVITSSEKTVSRKNMATGEHETLTFRVRCRAWRWVLVRGAAVV